MKRWVPVLLLAACTARAPAPSPSPAPVQAPAWNREAAGAVVYAVLPAESLVVVTVRRGGLLAGLGHDHVVASHNLSGHASVAANRADVAFRVDELLVDEARMRSEAGLAPPPPRDAIDATRANMLAKVLDAGRFPLVRLHAERVEPDRLRVAVTLHGATRVLDVPATISASGNSVAASGTLTLRQTDFGIEPLSLAGGLLAVQDALEIRFRIVARQALR